MFISVNPSPGTLSDRIFFFFTNILVQESLLYKMFSDNIQLASAPSIFLLNKSDCLLAASYPCLTSCGSSGNAQGLDLNFTSTSLSLTTSCLNFGFLAAPSHTFWMLHKRLESGHKCSCQLLFIFSLAVVWSQCDGTISLAWLYW